MDRLPKHKATDVRKELGKGLMLVLSGGLALAGLFGLTHFIQLDSLLMVSQANYNVISGVKGIAESIGRLLLGLAQMVGLAALAVVAVMGVLAVASGSLRIGLKLLPQMDSIWNLLANGLNNLTLLVRLPQRQHRAKGEGKHPSLHHRSVAPTASRRSPSAQRAA